MDPNEAVEEPGASDDDSLPGQREAEALADDVIAQAWEEHHRRAVNKVCS